MSDWTQIDPSRPETLPSEADCDDGGYVLWRWPCGVEEARERMGYRMIVNGETPIAWMRIPTYTPPRPQKPKRREWYAIMRDNGNAPSVFVGVCKKRDDADAFASVTTDVVVYVREVLPTDIDPDAAVVLLEAAREALQTMSLCYEKVVLQSVIDAATPKTGGAT